MSVHNELFNGVRQLRWQHLSPVVSTFSTISIRLLSSFFIKHCIHPPSFCPTHPVFLICGLSLRFVDVGVFFLQSKVCSYAVVPSSDHCRTEIVLSPSEHYCVETVAPSGDHYCIDIVVPSSDHCCNGAVPPSSDHYQTSKVHHSSISPPNSPFLG